MLRYCWLYFFFFFFSSRRRHTRLQGDWSSDVCSSDLTTRRPPVSGTTVQNAPAGMEPIGAPSPSSVTNSSPSPPSVTLDAPTDRKSTRLNSSHLVISYAVFCLKKKTTK